MLRIRNDKTCEFAMCRESKLSSSAWMAGELTKLANLRGGMKLESPRFNPRPAGVLQEGGAAKDVLSFLQQHPERYFTFSQIVTHTKRTTKSLDWACIFLRSLGYVECVRDDGRNPKYLRYRVAQKIRGNV